MVAMNVHRVDRLGGFLTESTAAAAGQEGGQIGCSGDLLSE